MQEMAAACEIWQIVASPAAIDFSRRACFLPAESAAVIPWLAAAARTAKEEAITGEQRPPLPAHRPLAAGRSRAEPTRFIWPARPADPARPTATRIGANMAHQAPGKSAVRRVSGALRRPAADHVPSCLGGELASRAPAQPALPEHAAQLAAEPG